MCVCVDVWDTVNARGRSWAFPSPEWFLVKGVCDCIVMPCVCICTMHVYTCTFYIRICIYIHVHVQCTCMCIQCMYMCISETGVMVMCDQFFRETHI